jgi:hypothetical protein
MICRAPSYHLIWLDGIESDIANKNPSILIPALDGRSLALHTKISTLSLTHNIPWSIVVVNLRCRHPVWSWNLGFQVFEEVSLHHRRFALPASLMCARKSELWYACDQNQNLTRRSRGTRSYWTREQESVSWCSTMHMLVVLCVFFFFFWVFSFMRVEQRWLESVSFLCSNGRRYPPNGVVMSERRNRLAI